MQTLGEYFALETEEARMSWMMALGDEQGDLIRGSFEERGFIETMTVMPQMEEFYEAYIALVALLEHMEGHRRDGTSLEGCGLAGPLLALVAAFKAFGEHRSRVQADALVERIEQFMKESS